MIVAVDLQAFSEMASKMAGDGGSLTLDDLKSLLADYAGLSNMPDQAPITVMRKLGGGEFSVSVDTLVDELKNAVSKYHVRAAR